MGLLFYQEKLVSHIVLVVARLTLVKVVYMIMSVSDAVFIACTKLTFEFKEHTRAKRKEQGKNFFYLYIPLHFVAYESLSGHGYSSIRLYRKPK